MKRFTVKAIALVLENSAHGFKRFSLQRGQGRSVETEERIGGCHFVNGRNVKLAKNCKKARTGKSAGLLCAG